MSGKNIRSPLLHRRTTVDDLINHECTNDITGRVHKYPHKDSESIGGGSYGNVYLGIMDSGMPTELKVVIKILRGVHTNPEGLKTVTRRLNREVAVWRPLRHPHIVEFLGLVNDVGPSPGLVSPFIEGKLMVFVEANPSERRRLAREIAGGMCYLHDNHVVHGDLKTENVLVSRHGHAKIIDFGIAQLVGVDGFTTQIERNARFTAPELMPIHEVDESSQSRIFFENRPTVASDTFSFGILLLQIRHGRNRDFRDMPYNHLRQFGHDCHVVRRVNEGDRPKRRYYSASISDSDWYLMCQCWLPSPDERPSMEWVSQFLSC